MIYIVIGSAVVYVIHMLDTNQGSILTFLAFHPGLIMRGEVWRLVTWVFFPLTDNPFFVAIALYFYYFVGGSLEREWGTGKFTIYYIFGFVLNIIYGFALWFVLGVPIPIIPNYLNLSMFFAFAVLFPDHVVRLFLIIPIKVKWLALVNGAFFVFAIISDIVNGHYFMAMLPVVALLNFILICGDDALAYLRPLRARTRPQAINFKRAAKKAKREQAGRVYRHKCAVCGKTDTDYPDLEFRYCSRCDGYHCYCIDHINKHVHFK